ncbi:hypothetical protein QNH47_13165 [Virgibacillus halodenitrificans]|uniref:hypothetical protein n=1 Tax=Virgibacillus halodenitrificans TaxID=1482 RepID=UPI0024C03572|nr:hypothetical protein [Virgibacillus halodenitrificans]WHX25117.1 hypothetical protein QNH47_13165 [Virgibacillus halodenitrificans]
MSIGEITASISVIISLVLAVSTVLKHKKDNIRAIETQTPVFKIERIQSFAFGSYTLLIRNVKDNFFVINNVTASDNRVDCEYTGVFEITVNQIDSGEPATKIYKGHAINIHINSSDDFAVSFNIEGVTISNRIFVVQTPIINFKDKMKQNVSIQDRFLKFIKK